MIVKDINQRIYYPPAFCPVCGIFEAVGTIGMASGGKVTLRDTGVICPTCRGKARMIDGAYEALTDRLKIVLDPALPANAKAALLSLVRKVRDKEVGIEAAKAEAERISPKASRLFDIADWSDQAKATLYAACLLAATTLLVAELSPGSDSPPIIINQTVNVPNPLADLQRKLEGTTSLTPAPPLPQRNAHRQHPAKTH